MPSPLPPYIKVGTEKYALRAVPESIFYEIMDIPHCSDDEIEELLTKLYDKSGTLQIRASAIRRFAELDPSKKIINNIKNYLKIVFQSQKYYTNLRELVTIKRVDQKRFTAHQHNLKVFSDMFYRLPESFTDGPSTSSLRGKTCYGSRSMLLEVRKYLNKFETNFIPLGKNGEFVLFSSSPAYKFDYFAHGVHKESWVFGTEQTMDKILNDLIQEMHPEVLKCCLNCKNFQFSGMSRGMSGGSTGYCKLLLEENSDVERTSGKLTTVINYCPDFNIKPH